MANPTEHARSSNCAPSRPIALFEALFRLLADSDAGGPADFLRCFTDHLQANVSGITPAHAQVSDESLVSHEFDFERLPWRANPSVLQQMLRTVVPQALQDAQGHWLLTLVWDPRYGEPLVVWALRGEPWGPEECAALRLSAPVLAQCMARPYSSEVAERAWQNVRLKHKLDRNAQVVSRLAHDFGNMLTSILGFAELTLNDLEPGSAVRPYLDEIVRSARDGADWVSKLRMFSRRQDPGPWPAPLHPLVAEQKHRVGADIAFEARLDDDVALIAIDIASARHILTQLVDNSLDAMKGRGTLTVSASTLTLSGEQARGLLGVATQGQYVKLSVRDSGPGFSDAARAKVFHELFYSPKPRYRGLGLLTIYGLMVRYGGALDLAPPGAGAGAHGAQVDVYLPVAELPTGCDAQWPAHVLVVVEDEVLRESLCCVLMTAGYRTSTAANAHDALALYQTVNSPIHLVLADIALPHLSGYDLALRLKDRDSAANFLFLQQTGHAQHLPQRDERLKAFPLIKHPCAPLDLLQAVDKAVH